MMKSVALPLFFILIVFLTGHAVLAAETSYQGSPGAPSVSKDGSLPSDGIPQGCILIEGDIIVPENFLISKSAFQTNLWTNRTVPYEFDANVTSANRAAMLAAMQEWEDVSAVTFVQCPGNSCPGNQANYLHIQNSNRNSSFVGMISGGQVVNIFNWNIRFIMAHELGHALGYWHEHQRSDRNDYLRAHFANADPSVCDAACFTTNFNTGAPENYGPYDFDSVMHYGVCAFAVTPCPCGSPSACQTLEVRMDCNLSSQTCTNTAMAGRPCSSDADCDPRLTGECDTDLNTCLEGTVGQPCTTDANCNISLGQRNHFSEFDAMTMSFLYPESNWRFVDKSYSGAQAGTFLRPYQMVNTGFVQAPSGGSVIIQPGSYGETGTYAKKMTLRAPLGGVTIGR